MLYHLNGINSKVKQQSQSSPKLFTKWRAQSQSEWLAADWISGISLKATAKERKKRRISISHAHKSEKMIKMERKKSDHYAIILRTKPTTILKNAYAEMAPTVKHTKWIATTKHGVEQKKRRWQHCVVSLLCQVLFVPWILHQFILGS